MKNALKIQLSLCVILVGAATGHLLTQVNSDNDSGISGSSSGRSTVSNSDLRPLALLSNTQLLSLDFGTGRTKLLYEFGSSADGQFDWQRRRAIFLMRDGFLDGKKAIGLKSGTSYLAAFDVPDMRLVASREVGQASWAGLVEGAGVVYLRVERVGQPPLLEAFDTVDLRPGASVEIPLGHFKFGKIDPTGKWYLSGDGLMVDLDNTQKVIDWRKIIPKTDLAVPLYIEPSPDGSLLFAATRIAKADRDFLLDVGHPGIIREVKRPRSFFLGFTPNGQGLVFAECTYDKKDYPTAIDFVNVPVRGTKVPVAAKIPLTPEMTSACTRFSSLRSCFFYDAKHMVFSLSGQMSWGLQIAGLMDENGWKTLAWVPTGSSQVSKIPGEFSEQMLKTTLKEPKSGLLEYPLMSFVEHKGKKLGPTETKLLNEAVTPALRPEEIPEYLTKVARVILSGEGMEPAISVNYRHHGAGVDLLVNLNDNPKWLMRYQAKVFRKELLWGVDTEEPRASSRVLSSVRALLATDPKANNWSAPQPTSIWGVGPHDIYKAETQRIAPDGHELYTVKWEYNGLHFEAWEGPTKDILLCAEVTPLAAERQ